MCVCERACVRACVCAWCVCVLGVCVCVCVCVYVAVCEVCIVHYQPPVPRRESAKALESSAFLSVSEDAL